MINNSTGLSVIFVQKDIDNRYHKLLTNFLSKGFVENSEWECTISGFENKKERALKDIYTVSSNSWNTKVLICRKAGFKNALSSENELDTLMDHLNYNKFLVHALKGVILIRGDYKVYISTISKNKIPSRNIFLMIEFSSVREFNVTLDQYKNLINNFIELFMTDVSIEEVNYLIENNHKAMQKQRTEFGESSGIFSEKQLGLLLLNFFGQ